ncbi:hypothetical protein ACS0TY_010295 [Phlomoides rotata]
MRISNSRFKVFDSSETIHREPGSQWFNRVGLRCQGDGLPHSWSGSVTQRTHVGRTNRPTFAMERRNSEDDDRISIAAA